MNLTDRDKRAIRWGAIILTLAGAVQFGVLPFINSWRDARSRAAALRVDLTDLETRINRAARQRQQLRAQLGDAFGQTLPSPAEARVGAPKRSEQLLSAHRIEVKSIRPQPQRPLRDAPGISLVSLQVEAVGQFAQIPAMIAAIRESDQLFIIERLSLSPAQRQPGKFDISMVLATPAGSEDRP